MTELTFGRFIVSCTLRSTSPVFPSSGLDSNGLRLFGLPGLAGLLEPATSLSACSFPGKRTISVLWVSNLSLKSGWLWTNKGFSLVAPSSGLVFWWWEWWPPGLFVSCGLSSVHVFREDAETDTAGVCNLSTSYSDVGFACGLFCRGLAAPCGYGFNGLVEPWNPESWWRFGFVVLDPMLQLEREEVDVVSLVVSFDTAEPNRIGLSVPVVVSPCCCCCCCRWEWWDALIVFTVVLWTQQLPNMNVSTHTPTCVPSDLMHSHTNIHVPSLLSEPGTLQGFGLIL